MYRMNGSKVIFSLDFVYHSFDSIGVMSVDAACISYASGGGFSVGACTLMTSLPGTPMVIIQWWTSFSAL